MVWELTFKGTRTKFRNLYSNSKSYSQCNLTVPNDSCWLDYDDDFDEDDQK